MKTTTNAGEMKEGERTFTYKDMVEACHIGMREIIRNRYRDEGQSVDELLQPYISKIPSPQLKQEGTEHKNLPIGLPHYALGEDWRKEMMQKSKEELIDKIRHDENSKFVLSTMLKEASYSKQPPLPTQDAKDLTIQEVKDKVARSKKYPNGKQCEHWDGFFNFYSSCKSKEHLKEAIDKAMTLFASQSSTANKGEEVIGDKIAFAIKFSNWFSEKLHDKKDPDRFGEKGFFHRVNDGNGTASTEKAMKIFLEEVGLAISPPLDREELLRWVDDRIKNGAMSDLTCYMRVKEKLLSLPPQKQSDAVECLQWLLDSGAKIDNKVFILFDKKYPKHYYNPEEIYQIFKSETNK